MNHHLPVIRYLMVGDSQQGKTSIISRYVDNYVSKTIESTIGVEFWVKQIVNGNYRLKLHFWDTSGQEHFQPLLRSYYKKVDIVCIVFDITKPDLNTIKKYYNVFKKEIKLNTIVVIIANKTDMQFINVHPEIDLIKKWADLKHFLYYQVSALKSKDIIDMFNDINEKAIDQIPRDILDLSKPLHPEKQCIIS